MERAGSKKSSSGRDTDDKPWLAAAKEEVLPGYEEYLVLLQERNRLQKRLREKNKDKDQVEKERREHGFSLYVNGPHKNARPSGKSPGSKATIPTQPQQPKTARKPKTAGEVRNPNILDNQALVEIARLEVERQRDVARAKTAPNARERRRNWNVESMEIKTTDGGKKVKAPDILTGRYADDFESGEDSDDVRSSGSENTEIVTQSQHNKPVRKPQAPRESDMFNSSDSYCSEDEKLEMSKNMSTILDDNNSADDMELDASRFTRPGVGNRKNNRPNRQASDNEDESDDDHPEKLLLSMKELRTLRQSLARNATIRESLAKESGSGDEDFTPESPIPEIEEEDIPSDDSEEDSPRRHFNLKPSPQKQPEIVLEFGGGPAPNKKVEKSLSAARRKDADQSEVRPRNGQKNISEQTRESGNKSGTTRTLEASENAGKKAVRPLSANRKTPVRESLDPDGEASAVMAALKAENEQASQKKMQTPKQKPSPRAAQKSPGKPAVDRSEGVPKSRAMSKESPAQSVSGPLVSMDKIEQIMEKVLKMSPKHQRRLVHMLGKIEKSVVAESVENPIPATRPAAKGPMRAVHTSVSQSLTSSNGAPSSGDSSDVIELHIEVRSNWGHAMRLGLTEIQVYDQRGDLVAVSGDDVSVHGAEDCQGSVDVLFNGKFKTMKERNMWSCRYHARRPVEFIINVRKPRPKASEKFALSQIKIWNFNKSTKDLDIGIKDIRIFVGSDLLFTGPVDKGCGNHVFDYGHVISLVPSVNETNPVIEVEKDEEVSSSKPENTVAKSMSDKRQKRREANEARSSVRTSRSKDDVRSSDSRQSISKESVVSDKGLVLDSKSTEKVSQINKSNVDVLNQNKSRLPISPRGEISPAHLQVGNKSPREGVASINHRSISPRPSQDRKKTFHSISISSQSSASDGGESLPSSRPSSGVMTPAGRPVRSETRTLVKQPGSGSESDDTALDASKPSHPSKKPSAKTPRKSKRMGARLDGHSSAEVDSSRSVSESMESRPPVSHRKLEEKILRKSVVEKYLDKPSGPQPPAQQPVAMEMAAKQEPEPDLDDTLKAGNATVSSSVSVASSQDDTPMLQKLKAMNNKDQTSSRKKDIPRWLKQEDILTPFQSPAESRDVTTGLQGAPPRTPPTQEEINMLIDEELSQFPEKRKPGPSPVQTVENSEGSSTPMQRIEKNRSKWRENPGMNLEESWGSLTQFNKSQRGRLSLDMDDDVLDEYINKAAKLAGLPTEPAIQEEETPSTEPSAGIYINSEDEDFIIPELPYGRELVVNIRSTWGDKHYVGLTGIEVFSATGEQANIVKIRADPSDINILPEYDKDPRVVKNLIDGSNRTRDDIHMWLAPFTAGRDHLVLCSFEKPCKVALIRIWNYNKSRIHSYRGAKDVVMTLDSTVIFRGEIARACGGIEGGTEAFGDTILFTTDEGILELVSQNDAAYEGEMLSDDEPFDVERPSTADAGEEKGRPLTRAVGNIKQLERELTVQYEGNMMVYRGKCIELNFTATWGDMHYLGLTGLEVVGKEGEAIPINITMLTANPRDVRTLPGHEKDDRTLDKVIDGNNVTVSDEHMWLVPFVEGQSHTLTIDFGEKVLLAGLRIWNYNKSKEDTYRGARTVHVSIDGKVVSPPEGFLVRKGPGNCHFDFAQEISFSPQSWNTGLTLSALGSAGMVDESDNYEVVQMPCGFIYQLQLFSTWGDAYYVGLNGIELYDGNLQKIELTQNNISAFPDSVNILEKMQNDVRTPDKLIDGVNDTMEGGHMWLAPIIPNHLNRVYVIFDVPTTISMIKIWNYSKTPNRGAKDFALLVDDLLVYNGVLQAVTQGARGILPNCQGPQPYHTILFTNNKDVLRKEKHTVINNQTGEQDVQMTNDKKIMSHYNDPKKTQSGKPVDQNLRPTTSVIVSKKRR
ncbi:katanin-interacting protein-like isoform X2 [Dreissena polymorpha]|uniref:katanin-interacting protein-like isoform X2 n=1 Tax=Dreissena polymorpha TaxID=45954 RepID=UPI002264FC92|nr:katanin-interacting protein-like isoform X2 [Dreissena polymorpha]